MRILDASTEVQTSDARNHRQGMIWVEVTNGCNLNCSHCYSDSFPGSQARDRLTHDDYLRIVDEASDLGMSTIQFIGGEPLLYKRLPELIERAQAQGFESVEIFSNLTAGRPEVYGVVDPAKTSFATSVYSHDAAIHDLIVKRVGSFSQTIANIRNLVARRIRVRTSFIQMEINVGQYDQTAQFLYALGVSSVGFDQVREFGRGGEQREPCMSQLCGACAGNTLCVTYEGQVLPCIMSRAWPIGNTLTHSLRVITEFSSTTDVRAQIAQKSLGKSEVVARCNPAFEHGSVPTVSLGCPPFGCSPCGPSHPACGPANPACGPAHPTPCLPSYPAPGRSNTL